MAARSFGCATKNLTSTPQFGAQSRATYFCYTYV
jgi:hypothetical protein